MHGYGFYKFEQPETFGVGRLQNQQQFALRSKRPFKLTGQANRTEEKY